MNASAYSYENVQELVDVGMPEAQAKVVVRQQAETKENLVTTHYLDLKIELLKKDLMLKLGGLIVGGFVATIGMMVGFLPVILK